LAADAEGRSHLDAETGVVGVAEEFDTVIGCVLGVAPRGERRDRIMLQDTDHCTLDNDGVRRIVGRRSGHRTCLQVPRLA
jgi:hypothetical protein